MSDAVELGVLAELTGYAVKRAQIRIFDDFLKSVGDPAITPQRFTAMVLIANNPGISQIGLGRTMRVARSGIKLLVDWLQASGFAERRINTRDRRTWGLYLTRRGQQRRRKLEQLVLEHDCRIVAQLSSQELAVLLACLPRLAPDT